MFSDRSPYRQLGDVTYRQWYAAITGVGGPAEFASRETWEAAKPHSALLLALAWTESKYGTFKGRNDPSVTLNPWSFRVPNYAYEQDVRGYLKFDGYPEAASHGIDRIVTGEFWLHLDKPDPYADAVTIRDLLSVFSPPQYNQTERLITEVVGLLNGYEMEYDPEIHDPGEMPMATSGVPDVWPQKRVPVSEFIVALVEKPAHTGSAWGYRYSPTPRHNVAVMHHETQGRGTGYWYQQFFSCPNGERCRDALVDFLIERDGTIFMLNNPFSHWGGWANGGGATSPGGLEGDGPAFWNRFGADGVDFKTVSIEYEKLDSENYTDAQIESGARLAAWIHDLDDQPWQTHPYVEKYGCVVSLLHFEIGTSNCGRGEIDDISKVQARTKQIMKQYQENPAEPPKPVYATPQPPPKGTHIRNDYLFLAPGGKTVQREQAPMLWANPNSPATGPAFPKGHKFTQEDFTHYVVGDDNNVWVVLRDGSRFPALAFVEG